MYYCDHLTRRGRSSSQWYLSACTSTLGKLSQLMRLWYLSNRRPAMAQASLRISAVSPEPSLFAHLKYGSRRRVWPKMYLRGFSTRSDSNQPAQLLKLAWIFKLCIYQAHISNYLSSEQQRCWSDCADAQADLHICTFFVRIWHRTHFRMTWPIYCYLILRHT